MAAGSKRNPDLLIPGGAIKGYSYMLHDLNEAPVEVPEVDKDDVEQDQEFSKL